MRGTLGDVGFIHDATRQLVIGPYVIDEKGGVRAVSPTVMEGRLSAAAAHPLDPAGKVLVYDMEGLLYEFDVTSYVNAERAAGRSTVAFVVQASQASSVLVSGVAAESSTSAARPRVVLAH